MDQNKEGWSWPKKLVFVVVLLLIGGVIGYWLGRRLVQSSDENGESSKTGSPESGVVGEGLDLKGLGTMVVGGNAIAVNDQAAGGKVDIQMVTLAKDGWVVVHGDMDGKPGGILGARRFNAGENQTGVVELLKPTEEGKVYYAMLHSDDGDRAFDYKKDLPVADPQGNAIMMRFVTTSKPGQ